MDTHAFLPLAMAETSEFYWKQEAGRFDYRELLSIAVIELATSPGSNHARVAIRGALLDHARDGDKLVRDVELTEEEWRRTHDNIPAPERDMGTVANAAIKAVAERDAKRIPPGTVLRIEDGVTYLSPGPYRTNAQLLAGNGRVTSKHDKVPCAIGRAKFDDDWNQEIDGQVGIKADADGQADIEADRLSKANRVPQRGQLGGGKRPKTSPDYKGAGRHQRWSKSCLSSGGGAGIIGVALKSVPDFWPRTVNGHVAIGPFLYVPRQPATARVKKVAKFKVKVRRPEPGRWTGEVRVREDLLYGARGEPVPNAATSVRFGLGRQDQPAIGREARAIAKLLAEVPIADKEASPEAVKMALSMELPNFPSIPWHREAGYIDMSHASWGLPDFGVFLRGDLPYFGKKKNPWRRGKNIFTAGSKISGLGGYYV